MACNDLTESKDKQHTSSVVMGEYAGKSVIGMLISSLCPLFFMLLTIRFAFVCCTVFSSFVHWHATTNTYLTISQSTVKGQYVCAECQMSHVLSVAGMSYCSTQMTNNNPLIYTWYKHNLHSSVICHPFIRQWLFTVIGSAAGMAQKCV